MNEAAVQPKSVDRGTAVAHLYQHFGASDGCSNNFISPEKFFHLLLFSFGVVDHLGLPLVPVFAFLSSRWLAKLRLLIARYISIRQLCVADQPLLSFLQKFPPIRSSPFHGSTSWLLYYQVIRPCPIKLKIRFFTSGIAGKNSAFSAFDTRTSNIS